MLEIKLAKSLFIRYFWYLTIVLAIFILVLGYTNLIKPKLALIRPGGIFDVKGYENILSQEKQHLNRVKALVQEYEGLKSNPQKLARLEKLSYVLADKLDEPSLFFIFQSLNAQHQIVPTSFVPTSGKGVTKIKISFTGKDYFQFKNYLKTLEDSIRLMDVSNIQMSVREGNYTIELLTYYLEDNQ
ncbi:MAG: hypothetical protein ACP5IX_00885 [Patescibacteria group bacterium]